MDREFWLQAWQDKRTGFHREATHHLLARHWPVLGLNGAGPVVVPLCGKTRDMVWLHEQGHPVTGVEFSDSALTQFVDENGLDLDRTSLGYEGKGYRLLCGDWFTAPLPTDFAAFYDRAALVALPPETRPGYVKTLASRLAPGAAGLLITLEYDPAAMDGPPFSVTGGEVRRLFDGLADVEELERNEVLEDEPRFIERGLRELQEVAWRIVRT